MPRNPLKDQQLRQERTKQILDSTSRVFARKGIQTKVSEIAADAGLSHGHIYNYFGSKEEILITLIHQGQDAFTKLLLDTQQQAGTVIEKLRNMSTFIIMNKDTDILLVTLQALSSDVLSEEAKKVIRQRVEDNLSLCTALIEDGQREGSIMQGDAKEIATLFISVLHDFTIFELRGFKPATPLTIELLLQMVGTIKEG
ncbi:AcrR family transcriptional regulator [Paenibacillus sp. DS2015]|uniref:TetR/AcrR family transcriptional regulator n=1 Tax=Paenibacillus sp. DS2015 TaxID=3373917 RepID=UPI003D1C6400